MKRRCKVCPKETQAVCRHVWGVYWSVKSDDGKGCDAPMDGVVEAWRKAGWTPGGKSVPITLPLKVEQATPALNPALPSLEDL